MLNGKSVLRFDGADDGLMHPLSLAGDNTVFVVARSNEVGNAVKVLYTAMGPSVGLRAYLAAEFNSSGAWGTYRAGGEKISGASLRNSYKIISLNTEGTNGSFSTNGSITNFTSPGFYSDGLDRRFVGGASPANGENCACDIAEILVFPTALSSTDRAKVESYLNAKWACY